MSLPPVAVGLSVREPWFDALHRLPTPLRRGSGDAVPLDVIEVIVDRMLASRRQRRAYIALSERFPVIAHGVYLGIGDARGVDRTYLERVGRACADLGARWYGEHLCFLNGDGTPLEHFGPLGDDADTLRVLRANIDVVRSVCPTPFVLENPADVLGYLADGPAPGERLGRAFSRAVTHADVGALLDLTNLVYNARNDGYEAARFLDELPWDRVVQVHLAGGKEVHGLWIDSHEAAIEDEALRLLSDVVQRAPQLRAVIVEWDESLPELDGALGEVERARRVVKDAGR